MKILKVFLIVLFVCSCHNNVDNSSIEYSDILTSPDNSPIEYPDVLARHDEIRRILREDAISWHVNNSESLKYMSDEHRDKILEEFRKMKEDFYYESDLINLTLTICGPGWEIYGPLLKTDEGWEYFEQYKNGDELYYYVSDEDSWRQLRGHSGYVLIRENKVVDQRITVIN